MPVDEATDSGVVSGVARVARPSEADIAIVRALVPLSADLMIRCGPFDVPVAVIASSTTLEQENSDEAQIARDFVAEDPWHGMGSVYPGGWMLLARDDDTVVIGQRRGDVGLGSIVTLVREGERFDARSMGGWQWRPRNPNEQLERAYACTVRADAVRVAWSCGQDLDGVPDRVFARVEVLERPDEVHFLLLSALNPDRPPPRWAIMGTDGTQTATFVLSEPLRSRPLLNDASIPPRPMTIGVDSEA